MANKAQTPPGDLELTGEYLEAMETVSATLMNRLPGNDELWRTLGETETLLLEAQLTKTPVSTLFGKGGVAGFCQSIIDEKGGKMSAEGKSAAPRSRKQRQTNNLHIRRKKNMITALIIVVWLLLIAFLIGQYTGFVRYMFHPQTFYLQELHNFNAEVTEVPLSQTTVTIPLKVQAPEPQILYRDENYTVTLTYVSFDEDSYTQKNPTRRWWVEISYTRHASFNEVSYVSPAQSGTATVTLANGETMTQELRWQGEGYDENTAFVRLCFLEVPKDTPTEGCFASISFDAMSHVRWTRTGIGSRAN